MNISRKCFEEFSNYFALESINLKGSCLMLIEYELYVNKKDLYEINVNKFIYVGELFVDTETKNINEEMKLKVNKILNKEICGINFENIKQFLNKNEFEYLKKNFIEDYDILIKDSVDLKNDELIEKIDISNEIQNNKIKQKLKTDNIQIVSDFNECDKNESEYKNLCIQNKNNNENECVRNEFENKNLNIKNKIEKLETEIKNIDNYLPHKVFNSIEDNSIKRIKTNSKDELLMTEFELINEKNNIFKINNKELILDSNNRLDLNEKEKTLDLNEKEKTLDLNNRKNILDLNDRLDLINKDSNKEILLEFIKEKNKKIKYENIKFLKCIKIKKIFFVHDNYHILISDKNKETDKEIVDKNENYYEFEFEKKDFEFDKLFIDDSIKDEKEDKFIHELYLTKSKSRIYELNDSVKISKANIIKKLKYFKSKIGLNIFTEEENEIKEYKNCNNYIDFIKKDINHAELTESFNYFKWINIKDFIEIVDEKNIKSLQKNKNLIDFKENVKNNYLLSNNLKNLLEYINFKNRVDNNCTESEIIYNWKELFINNKKNSLKKIESESVNFKNYEKYIISIDPISVDSIEINETDILNNEKIINIDLKNCIDINFIKKLNIESVDNTSLDLLNNSLMDSLDNILFDSIDNTLFDSIDNILFDSIDNTLFDSLNNSLIDFSSNLETYPLEFLDYSNFSNDDTIIIKKDIKKFIYQFS